MRLNQFYFDSANGCIVCTVLLGALQCEHLCWASIWTIVLEMYLISWGICSILFSVTVVNHSDQKLLEDRVYLFQHTLPVTVITEGRQGRDSSWELGAETMDEGCLVACSLATLRFLTLTMGGTVHNGLGTPTYISTENNGPQSCQQANLI